MEFDWVQLASLWSDLLVLLESLKRLLDILFNTQGI